MTELNMQQAEVSKIMDMVDEYHAILNDESGSKEVSILRQAARQLLRDAIERLAIDRDGWHAEYRKLLKVMHRGGVVLGPIESED